MIRCLEYLFLLRKFMTFCSKKVQKICHIITVFLWLRLLYPGRPRSPFHNAGKSIKLRRHQIIWALIMYQYGKSTWSHTMILKLFDLFPIIPAIYRRIQHWLCVCEKRFLLHLKGTVSWDRFKKCWWKWTDLGLNKGRGWVLNFLETPLIFSWNKTSVSR